MRLAVVGAGPITTAALTTLYQYDLIYAADGGADCCVKAGVTPDKIIGDGDSSTVPFMHTTDQNTTDLQKVLAVAPADATIDLYGVISEERFDHTLTVLQLLRTDKRIQRIITEHWITEIYRAQSTANLLLPLHTVISIVPVTTSATVSLTGLQWSGTVQLSAHRSGISNVVTALPARVTVDNGSIFVMLPWPYGLNLPC